MNRSRSPWFWVPSLYFSQGIPYVIVMTMSVVMYKRLGISNTEIALYTSWLYLPWVIKPLWSPLVDMAHTKRGWIVAMQFLVGFALALTAFSVPGGDFFRWSLFLFWIMAFASATHDIAADGFYMLALSQHEQAWWVGLRSTFYRTAMVVGSGLLVVLAGVLEGKNGLPPVEVKVISDGLVGLPSHWDPARITLPEQTNTMQVVVRPVDLPMMGGASPAAAESVIQQAKSWNAAHGFELSDQAATSSAATSSKSWWGQNVSGPLGNFLTVHFPKAEKNTTADEVGNVGTYFLGLSRAPEHPVAVNVAHKLTKLGYFGLGQSDKDFRVVEGAHLVFNATNWNQKAIAVIQMDSRLKTGEATFEVSSGNIPLAWAITLLVVTALFLGFSCWHSVMLPRPAKDGPVTGGRTRVEEFWVTLGSFFQKPGIGMALAFILLYRFDEAQLSKVITPFLLDSRTAGGLGLLTSQVGLAYGTFGILALTCGGLLGGFLAAKHGLKKMLPIMVGAMYLPKLVFLFLSFVQPENFLVIGGAVAVEQFGYGFGFTAFMLYLLYFADGPHRTAHYAIGTGLMALGMMIPGMWSGWLVDAVGYRHFFVWVIASALPGLIVALRLKVDAGFGRRGGNDA